MQSRNKLRKLEKRLRDLNLDRRLAEEITKEAEHRIQVWQVRAQQMRQDRRADFPDPDTATLSADNEARSLRSYFQSNREEALRPLRAELTALKDQLNTTRL